MLLNRYVLAHLQLAICSVMMYCNLVGMLNKISSLTKMKNASTSLTGCHDCWPNSCRTPSRMESFQEAGNARNMRTWHWSAWNRVEFNSALVKYLICWTLCFSIGSYDINSWCSDIGLHIQQLLRNMTFSPRIYKSMTLV